MGIIKPKDFKSSQNYDEVSRDKWFSILRIKSTGSFLSSFNNKDKFVIILESKPIPKIVAEDVDKDKIIHLWNILHETVSKLNIHDDDMSESDKMLYITSKIEAMAVKMEAEEKENRTKALLLNHFGVDEPLIISYKCTLKGNPFSGVMYITNYKICFYSQASSISIRIRDIASIKKEYVFSLMDGIKITEDNGIHYTFTNFDDRDEVFNSICSLWYIYMDHILDHEEFLAAEKARVRIERREGIIQDDEVPAYQGKIHRVKSYKELKELNITSELSNIFRFPSDEKLHYIFHCGFLEQKANIYVKGKLYITDNFVSFYSFGKSLVKFTFPFFDIHCIEKSINNETSSVIIHAKNIVAEFIGTQKEVINVFGLLVKMKNSLQDKTSTVNPERYIQEQYSDKIIQLISMTRKSDKYIENKDKINKELENNEILDEWSNYFSLNGEGYCIIRTELFDKLIEKGIPNRLRGFLWQYCSGSLNNSLIFESNGYFNKLLEKAKKIQEEGDPDGIFEEIEKDLMRSFPEHPYYQTEEGINSLRNVLMACSLHNEKIGYCQAMNIVCSILLLYMDERASFYLMNLVCEYFMPRCFTKSMAGSLIDQNIFEQLLRQRLPELYKHLVEENVPIKAVVIPWFLCLFVDCFPLDTVLRIFDLFFLNGVQSLYQVALSIFSYNEKRILSLHDGYNITALLKEDNRITPEILINEINEKFSDINLENSIFYRRFHAHRRVNNITKSWMNRYIEKIMTSISNIPLNDIKNFYNMYIDVIKVESVFLPSIGEKEYFLFMRNFEWYNMLSPDEKKKTYILAKRDDEGKINLKEILSDLSVWRYSGIEGKLLYCTQLFGYDNDSLSLSQTFDVVYLLAKIEKRPLTQVKEFVKNVFIEMNLKEEESTNINSLKMYINRIFTNE